MDVAANIANLMLITHNYDHVHQHEPDSYVSQIRKEPTESHKILCPECHAELQHRRDVCAKCGYAAQNKSAPTSDASPDIAFCPSCGHEYTDADEEKCSMCGTDIPDYASHHEYACHPAGDRFASTPCGYYQQQKRIRIISFFLIMLGISLSWLLFNTLFRFIGIK